MPTVVLTRTPAVRTSEHQTSASRRPPPVIAIKLAARGDLTVDRVKITIRLDANSGADAVPSPPRLPS
jgi:hypothetical protein